MRPRFNVAPISLTESFIAAQWATSTKYKHGWHQVVQNLKEAIQGARRFGSCEDLATLCDALALAEQRLTYNVL